MQKRGLFDLIRYLQSGTRLHIGVLFFGRYGNELCRLPHAHTIHSSPVCTHLKQGSAGFRRCFRCRNMALRKALREKKPFGGLCSGGVYEYTHPVVIGGEVAAVIFIGNLLVGGEENKRLLSRLGDMRALLATMEESLCEADAAAMAELIEAYIRLLLEDEDPTEQADGALIANVKSYIRESLEYDLGTAHIAEVFHYNKSYLGRVFKREVGMSVSQYLQKERVARAKALLCEGKLPVTRIAARCGFADVAYFNRVFKALENTTPTQYRRLQQRGAPRGFED